MKNINIIRAVIGFIMLSTFYLLINIIDFTVVYAIFLSFQFLLAPLFTAFSYFVAVVRLSLPYIFMYILICVFINLPYRKNYTIKFLKYSINMNAVQNTKLYIYLIQYNYIIIFSINFLILFMIYYSYMNNRYLYLFFILLFYFFIWIIIKIKYYLFKNQNLQAKRVHMFINIILVVLVGAYISMALEDLHISNFKFAGFESYWKLLDNKYFIKYSLNSFKDYNWNRLFHWSKQISQDRYMYTIKKSLMQSNFMDTKQSIENKDFTSINDYLPMLNSDKCKSLILKETMVVSNKIENDDLNLNTKLNLFDYLFKNQNEDYNSNISKFTNSFYNKFKKIFLLNLKIKTYNFLPASEINERKNLINWLHHYSSAVDLSEFYVDENINKNVAYNDYLDLVEKNFNNWTTKKVFLISLTNNKNFKNFVFFADHDNSLRKNYTLFLNSQKQEIDKFNIIISNTLDFEYTNIDLYKNIDFKTFWNLIKSEILILYKENKINLLSLKFKSLYIIRKFNFSLKEDILIDSDLDMSFKTKTKPITIPNFKKLLVWKTFKLNYKEIICQYANNKKLQNMEFNKWYKSKSLIINKKPIVHKLPNDIYFVFDDDVSYVLSDYKELYQVEDLEFEELPSEEYNAVSNYIQNYLTKFKNSVDLMERAYKPRYTKVVTNELDQAIIAIQDKRFHIPKFSSMYNDILWQNSNEFFKIVIANISFFKTVLISFRPLMDYETWHFIMNKILNLKINSFYLQNFNDFSLNFKNDLTGDLKFNFSLALKILQSKYDLMKFQMIPDLEGIPGTFYEYTVKYNAHMEKYFWYEEQEELIDWIYELSYDALVELMDTVKEVDSKENDFLFDMLNAYLLDKKYKWVPELHNLKMLKDKVNWNLIKLNEQLELIYELEDQIMSKQLMILQPDTTELNFIDLLNSKRMHVLDFKGIKNIEQLNLKLGRDLNIIKYLVRWQQFQLIKEYPELLHKLTNEQVKCLDNKIIQIFGKVYSETQNIDNIDLGAAIGVGYFVDSNYNSTDLLEIEVLDDFLDEQAEVRLMLKQEYYLDEMDFEINNEQDLINNEQDLIIKLKYMLSDIQNNYEKFLYNYLIKFKEAKSKVLYNMMDEIELKKKALALIDKEYDVLNVKKQVLLDLRDIELYKEYLKNLPIFDWSTYSILDENIELLKKENTILLTEKLDKLSVDLDNFNSTMLILKKNTKLYGEQFLAYTKWSDPVAKKYIETNWDDFNSKTNKTDKFKHDLFKKRK